MFKCQIFDCNLVKSDVGTDISKAVLLSDNTVIPSWIVVSRLQGEAIGIDFLILSSIDA
jgi:hypothetical protein